MRQKILFHMLHTLTIFLCQVPIFYCCKVVSDFNVTEYEVCRNDLSIYSFSVLFILLHQLSYVFHSVCLNFTTRPYSFLSIEITTKMRPCSRIYYSNVFLIAQHVSSDTPLIIRSSKTVIAASGFTYVCGCNYSF